MLLIEGRVLETSTRTGKTRDDREFTVEEVHILTGKSDVETAAFARDFKGPRPQEGQQARLLVAVRGAGNGNYYLTALENIAAPAVVKAS